MSCSRALVLHTYGLGSSSKAAIFESMALALHYFHLPVAIKLESFVPISNS